MRIIAGTYGGRPLTAPKTRGTRPLAEKVREAVFNILAPWDDQVVLDAYAGSGALGFEALSRGAASVVAVEMGQAAVRAIRANARALGVGVEYELVPVSVESWLARSSQAGFTTVFALPPYAAINPTILGRLGATLAPGGTMVVEYPIQIEPAELDGLQLVSRRSYGDSVLALYRPR